MRPMLAGKLEDPAAISYPILASPKLDGVRCLTLNNGVYSRNLKPIPNKAIQEILGNLPPMDGELIVGAPRGEGVFNRTSSGVMSREGVPKFKFYVFDVILNKDRPFHERLEMAQAFARSCGKNVEHVPHKLIHSAAELLEYEAAQLLAGFEGIMIRSLEGPYKQGRSTLKEGYLLKLKRFEDGEAVVVGFEEKMHNDNEQTRDELGRAKRSSHKQGKRAGGTLGALIVKDKVTGVQFNIGTGYSESERADIWARRRGAGSFLGRLAKYRYQPIGAKEAPRFPTFLGWRDEGDM